jgi:UDP-glucose 4-epimerase
VFVTQQATWVVTGAGGFLGSHVTEQLLGRGIRVAAVDTFTSGRREFLAPHSDNPLLSIHETDIRDTSALTSLFQTLRPEAVVHLAAIHFIPAAMKDPPGAVSLNVHGTQSVLTACTAADVPRFWFASTGDVYAPEEQPHREETPRRPFNIYGLTKSIGEQLIELESRNHPHRRFFVGRLFNLYGPRETNPHILPEILTQLRDQPTAPLRLGNLWPKRDMVPTADAARAVIETTMAAPQGVTTMNVATGEARSMQEVLDIIGELLGRPLNIETDPAKVRPVERNHLQADVSRLRHLIGWAPSGDLRNGLQHLLQYEGFI